MCLGGGDLKLSGGKPAVEVGAGEQTLDGGNGIGGSIGGVIEHHLSATEDARAGAAQGWCPSVGAGKRQHAGLNGCASLVAVRATESQRRACADNASAACAAG